VKVKIITALSSEDLETALNGFLSTLEDEQVVDVKTQFEFSQDSTTYRGFATVIYVENSRQGLAYGNKG
jgi:hypothetical protein